MFYPFLTSYFLCNAGCTVNVVSLFVMFILLLLLTEELKKNVVVGLKLKGEFKQVYDNLENSETKTLVQNIKNNVSALVKIIMINLKLVL